MGVNNLISFPYPPSLTVRLPWPPFELSPNGRVHWAVKSKRTKVYRHDAMLLARCAKGSLLPDQDYIVLGTALPPNKNRRDRDNVQAAIKSGFDGVAQAYKVDDSRFHPFTMLGEARKGGDILLEFYTPEDMNAGSRDSVSAD